MAQAGTFIQIINVTSDRYDELAALDQKYREEAGTESTAQIVTTCKNRSGENNYTIIVEFPNYAEAMKNSESPQTQQLAEQMAKLCTSVEFVDLDVIESQSV